MLLPEAPLRPPPPPPPPPLQIDLVAVCFLPCQLCLSASFLLRCVDLSSRLLSLSWSLSHWTVLFIVRRVFAFVWIRSVQTRNLLQNAWGEPMKPGVGVFFSIQPCLQSRERCFCANERLHSTAGLRGVSCTCFYTCSKSRSCAMMLRSRVSRIARKLQVAGLGDFAFDHLSAW